MSAAPVVFTATGTIQTYFVPAGGTYLIEAAGAQGGAGASPGLKGARVSGMFYLKRGDLLKIVAGSQGTPAAPPDHPSGGGGGSSMVWTGPSDLPAPIKLMLSARGGKGGTASEAGGAVASRGSDSGDPAADSNGVEVNGAGMDPLTVDTLATQWTRGAGPGTFRPGVGADQIDRSGYNAGSFRTYTPDVQLGDGYVSVAVVSAFASSGSRSPHPTPATAPAIPDASAAAPASAIPGASDTASPPQDTPPIAGDDPCAPAPSQTMLPRVTPRLTSWKELLRRRRRP